MIGRINFSISASYLEQMIRNFVKIDGWEISEIWHDDADFVFHVKGKINAKIKLRPVSHQGLFLAFDIRRVIVNQNLLLSGTPLDMIVSSFKKMIERKMPFANIKVAGSTIYIENIKTQNIALRNGFIVGELFIEK